MMRTLIAVILLLVLAGNTEAVVGQGGFWLTGTGSYIRGTNTQSGQTIDGASLALTLEGMRGANVSLGLSLAYGVMEGEENVAGVVTKQRVSSMPAYILARYWLGEGNVQGYVGGAVGVYISFLDATNITDNKQTTLGTSGLALAIPAGFVYSVGDRMFFNFNYTLNWLVDNDYLDSGIVNSFGVGLGFTFSN